MSVFVNLEKKEMDDNAAKLSKVNNKNIRKRYFSLTLVIKRYSKSWRKNSHIT